MPQEKMPQVSDKELMMSNTLMIQLGIGIQYTLNVQ